MHNMIHSTMCCILQLYISAVINVTICLDKKNSLDSH